MVKDGLPTEHTLLKRVCNCRFVVFNTCREEEPLFTAIRDGDISRVKALVSFLGTNLMLPSKPGWLAIHQAAFYGHRTCLNILLSGTRIYSRLSSWSGSA